MGEFLRAALDFPAVLFGFALLVVVGYWLFVLVGATGLDAFPGGEDVGADSAQTAPRTGLVLPGLRGAPVAVTVSLLTAIAWLLSLVVTVLVPGTLLRLAALPPALLVALALTRLSLHPLRSLARPEECISHPDFVGRVCVVRTGRVDAHFGQAEVAAPDGAVALVQVRTDDPLPSGLTAGAKALIYAYEAEGGHFLVAPYDAL
ncbi:hypothetical protein N566_09995 [Streptomycetaceae bacterium MP113-05]|nr:hypothetical protein N566_09995 [Streptomycetaceae bacterium MP113-05]